ncbi:MAG: multidrug efflux SMR transporter [Desulfovibrionaceae bacterium]|nr:multidrug efflux SMR transporter [Desulfovibrionaceae bacterium]
MKSNNIYWVFLFMSIGFEVTGTSIMKASQESWPVLGMGLMFIMLSLAYFTLSKAVLRLPVGVAFACWEGLGLALITLVSALLLGEQINLLKLLAICMLLSGTYMVNRGTDEGHVPAPGEKPAVKVSELTQGKGEI